MNRPTNFLVKIGILKNDLDYHLLRTSMVIIFLFFGYQKWFEYEAQALIPYISHGPLIFWMYPAFGIRGATYFLGVAEWLFGGLLFLGFWNKRLGILGALGGCFSFVATVTIFRSCRMVGLPPPAGSRYDRESCIPNEGSRAFRCLVLSAQAGRCQSLVVRQTSAGQFDDRRNFGSASSIVASAEEANRENANVFSRSDHTAGE